jgi:hypothetical protein
MDKARKLDLGFILLMVLGGLVLQQIWISRA